MGFCREHRELVMPDSLVNCETFEGKCGGCPHFDSRAPIIDDVIPKEWIKSTTDMKWDCIGCGNCCRREGDFLELGATEFASGLNRLFPVHFVERFGLLIMVGSYFSFTDEPEDCQRCIWIEDNRCLIYDKRPMTCKIYPFQIYNATDPDPILWVDTRCEGLGQGRPIYTHEGKLRPDLWRMKEIIIPKLVLELLDSYTIGTELKRRKALKNIPNKGRCPGYESTINFDMQLINEHGQNISVPFIPDESEMAWRKRLKKLGAARIEGRFLTGKGAE